jgi:hypothetical protein
VHLKRAEKAPRELAGRLGLAPGARVFHSLIVHHDNGVPLQCEDRYVNPACAPGYLDVDFTRTTPTHYLLEVAPLWEAQYAIEASAADAARGAPARHRSGRPVPRRRPPHGEPRRADHARAARAPGRPLPARGPLRAMTPRLVTLAAVPPTPWKNGGGVTRELLAGRLRRRWTVRVSVAEIEADGPFSSFPGVERWFAVLEGGGVALTIDGVERPLSRRRPSARVRGRRQTSTAACSTARAATST